MEEASGHILIDLLAGPEDGRAGKHRHTRTHTYTHARGLGLPTAEWPGSSMRPPISAASHMFLKPGKKRGFQEASSPSPPRRAVPVPCDGRGPFLGFPSGGVHDKYQVTVEATRQTSSRVFGTVTKRSLVIATWEGNPCVSCPMPLICHFENMMISRCDERPHGGEIYFVSLNPALPQYLDAT